MLFGKRQVAALAAAGVLVLVSACGNGGGDGAGDSGSNTIKIGALGSFTGPIGAPSLSYLDGVKIAFDAGNKAGGVNGSQLELITLDDAGDAAKGKANVRTAIENDGVIGICCGVNSAVTGAVAPQLKSNKVPAVSIGAPSPDYLEPAKSDNAYFFISGLNAGVGEYKEMMAAAEKLLPNQQLKVGIAGSSTPAGQAFIKAATGAVGEKGWSVVASKQVSIDGTNTDPPAAEVAGAKPDIVFAAVSSTSRLPFFRALAQNGYAGPILLYSSGVDRNLLSTLNNPNLYGIVDYNYLDESNEASKKFRADAQAAGIDPSSALAPSGYSAGLLFIEALTKCGAGCTGEKLKVSLEGLSGFDGNGFYAGPLQISADSHDAFTVALVTHWVNGAAESAFTVTTQR